jgi:hypothetical protein
VARGAAPSVDFEVVSRILIVRNRRNTNKTFPGYGGLSRLSMEDFPGYLTVNSNTFWWQHSRKVTHAISWQHRRKSNTDHFGGNISRKATHVILMAGTPIKLFQVMADFPGYLWRTF